MHIQKTFPYPHFPHLYMVKISSLKERRNRHIFDEDNFFLNPIPSELREKEKFRGGKRQTFHHQRHREQARESERIERRNFLC